MHIDALLAYARMCCEWELIKHSVFSVLNCVWSSLIVVLKLTHLLYFYYTCIIFLLYLYTYTVIHKNRLSTKSFLVYVLSWWYNKLRQFATSYSVFTVLKLNILTYKTHDVFAFHFEFFTKWCRECMTAMWMYYNILFIILLVNFAWNTMKHLKIW